MQLFLYLSQIEFITKNIDGSIFILNGEIEEAINYAYNIYGRESEEEFEMNKWNYARRVEDNKREKYYFQEYSEGKVLIIKYSYENGRVKDSMNIVFDEIINSIK